MKDGLENEIQREESTGYESERVRLAVAQLAQDAPEELSAQVMMRIRAEIRRGRRRRILRISTAVAAAVVVIPAALLTLPMFLKTNLLQNEGRALGSREDEVLYASSHGENENAADAFSVTDSSVADRDTGNATETGVVKDLSGSGDEDDERTLRDSPDYVLESSDDPIEHDWNPGVFPTGGNAETGDDDESGENEDTSYTDVMNGCANFSGFVNKSADSNEMTVLRVILGESVLAEWLSTYNGDDVIAALCRAFSVPRSLFEQTAADLCMEFPDELLERLFPSSDVPTVAVK